MCIAILMQFKDLIQMQFDLNGVSISRHFPAHSSTNRWSYLALPPAASAAQLPSHLSLLGK